MFQRQSFPYLCLSIKHSSISNMFLKLSCLFSIETVDVSVRDIPVFLIIMVSDKNSLLIKAVKSMTGKVCNDTDKNITLVKIVSRGKRLSQITEHFCFLYSQPPVVVDE